MNPIPYQRFTYRYPFSRKTHKFEKHWVNPYGLYRNSKATAFAWRDKLDMGYIHRIQDSCRTPMDMLGYNRLESKTQREDKEGVNLVVKTRQEVWPYQKKGESL